MTQPLWVTNALSYIGQKEVKGSRHNPLVLRWWTAIRAPFSDDETPWCAGFVGGVLEEAGVRSTRSALARSYVSWGIPLKTPSLGAVLVFSRGPKAGHVGFYIGEDSESFHVLGGNQGDAVSIARVPKYRLLSIRWPKDVPVTPTGPIVRTLASSLSTNEA